MIHRTRLLLDTAALLAVLALPVPLSAQEAGRAVPAPETPTSVPVERPAAQAETPRQQAAAAAAAAREAKPSREDVMRSMRDAEVKHRERLAALHRLRELAGSQGQAERLALLDKLEVKENSHYNNVAQIGANRLGNTAAYKQSLMKLAAGRIRRNVPEAKAEAVPDEATVQKRKEAKQAKKAERAEQTEAERAAAPKADGDRATKTKAKNKDTDKADRPKADTPKAERKQSSSSKAATRSGARKSGGSGGGRAPRSDS